MGHNGVMFDPESLNAAHETERKFIDDLGSIGIPAKEVKLSGGGAKKVAQEGRMYMPALTHQSERKHNALLAEHARHLGERGVNISTRSYTCGHAEVTSMWRSPYGNGTHTDYPTTNAQCPSCRTSV
jgi:hypothetical protein